MSTGQAHDSESSGAGEQPGSESPADDVISRRRLLKGGGAAAVGLAAGGLLAACTAGDGETGDGQSEAATAATAGAAAATTTAPGQVSDAVELSLVTTWPPNFPIMGEGPILFAERVAAMSEGRLRINVFGAGELVPALEWSQAVTSGTADIGHGAAYYNAGRLPSSEFFAAVPFGMNAQQMNAWIYSGGGLELWEEIYEPLDLLPMPGGNTGVQMGGWFNREINSLEDYRGLKMRIPGLGGRVVDALGGSAELLPGGEIYTSLDRGLIDATEWVGPFHDEALEFYNVADYYYYPGWHEPGTVLEFTFNRSFFSQLSPSLQEIVRRTAADVNGWMLSQFEAQNNAALMRLVLDKGVDLRPFPDEVLDGLRSASAEVIDGVVSGDAASARVWDSFRAFQADVSAWGEVSEAAFYSQITAS